VLFLVVNDLLDY